MQSAITHLFAGVPVSDLDASIDWYTRLFGRPPDLRVGEEMLWEVDEHATLFIEPNGAWAGAGRITLAVAGLDALLERLAAQRIEHEPIETYSNGVRHVNIPDPDGNAIAFAEQPDAASASPRSAGTGASSQIADPQAPYARDDAGRSHTEHGRLLTEQLGGGHAERPVKVLSDSSPTAITTRSKSRPRLGCKRVFNQHHCSPDEVDFRMRPSCSTRDAGRALRQPACRGPVSRPARLLVVRGGPLARTRFLSVRFVTQAGVSCRSSRSP
jgi:catechol 2,3-dioxygenase-like lactoylglutathione lyase family enzyme